MANPDHHEAPGVRCPERARSAPTRIPLHGDIDAASASTVLSAMRAGLPLEPSEVEVDLTEVDFLGAAGLSIFVTCQLEGHRLHCSHARGTVALVLTTRAADFLQRRDTCPDSP